MRAVVFGYSNVGDRCLRVLRAQGVDVPLVVTHRDQPDETLWFARVSETAAELGLPVVFSDDLSARALAEAVAAAQPDVIFSFYYRAMLPAAILAIASQGAFNMHGSLLPRFRGRAPTNWAVLLGEKETGATLHEMIARPDAGAIVDQSAVPILPDDTAVQVFAKVTVAAEQVLWRCLPKIEAGRIPRRPNDWASGSYFGARKPEDGKIDWSRSAPEVYNLIRAVAPPYPGAFTEVAGVRVVIADARLMTPANAGPVLRHGQRGFHVVGSRIIALCGDGGQIEVRALESNAEPFYADSLLALLEADRASLVS